MSFFKLRLCWIWTITLFLSATLSGAEEPRYDLIIRNGTVVDGTGNPWSLGDVAIRGDRIIAVGRIPAGVATREIDARHLVVAPGFIDIHSHSDYLLLEDGNAPSKIRQGVTTEVLGEGNSAGPYPNQAGSRPTDPKVGRFATLKDYFDAVEQSGVAVNELNIGHWVQYGSGLRHAGF